MAQQTAYIALGANLGQPVETLRWAVKQLERLGQVSGVSSLYRTAPVGGPAGQPDYWNAAARLETELSAADLLAAMHGIEAEAGRVREVRWGPRTLDLDLILYGDLISDDPQLTLPHPRAWERGFVLAPLRDLDPQLQHPVLGTPASQALKELDTDGQVTLEGRGWV